MCLKCHISVLGEKGLVVYYYSPFNILLPSGEFLRRGASHLCLNISGDADFITSSISVFYFQAVLM